MRRARRGSNAIEFALLFPIVALLLLGALQWTFYFVQWESVIVAARAGAREGSRTAWSAGPAAAAQSAAAIALDGHYPFPVPTGTVYVGSTVAPDIVRIRVTMPVTPIANLRILSTPTSVSATAQMKVENLY